MTRLKRGELYVTGVRWTKAELETAPELERINYIMLGQTANELSMLRSMAIQSLNGAKGERAITETGLGMAFMLARLLAGRAVEAWGLVKKSSIGEQFAQNLAALDPSHADQVRAEVAAARKTVSEYFSKDRPLLAEVRKKLAFHHDAAAVRGAYALTPDEFELIDWHTGVRGSTFYGAADSLAAFAVSHLTGDEDPTSGHKRLIQEAPFIAGEIETIADGYLVAFSIRYFGRDRYNAAPQKLRNLPSIKQAKVQFFTSSSRSS